MLQDGKCPISAAVVDEDELDLFAGSGHHV
jgi:hypothetical protein